LTVVILKVAVGLGFVIFVHELGHFAVAKLCGVKCEKFYLGFDIAGLKFCKFRWGETEYGIGILPLGGYVKMLGQEDNPAKLREEMERARAQDGETGRGGDKETGNANTALSSPVASTSESPSLPVSQSPPLSCSPLYDPRSFLAKSVPKRMAIISAGVIMNLIFAFLMAVVAFGIGAPEPPCIVGEVFAGEAAWQANLQSGDEILEIAGKKMEKFRDLQGAITLGNIDAKEGVQFVIRRDGKRMNVTVKPENALGIFAIGVSQQYSTKLLSNRKTWLVFNRHAVIPGSAADRTKMPFQNGDKIVRIDGSPISNYGQIDRELARKWDKRITVVVERAVPNAGGKTEEVPIAVNPDPMRWFGLVMEMGPVTAIQPDSPAAAAGIRPDDVIVQPGGDPITLPDRLAREAGKTVEMKLKRGKEKEPVVCSVRPRQPAEISPSTYRNSPLGVPALGVAYRVLNKVAGVEKGSPADKAGMKPGDVLTRAKLLTPDKEELQKLRVDPTEDLVSDMSIDFGDGENNWPSFMHALQNTLPGTRIELTFMRDGKEQTLPTAKHPMVVVTTPDACNPDRGFRFESMMYMSRGHSLSQMVALGGARTLDDVTFTFHTVRALGTGQVPLRALGGPWMIIKLALYAADQGLPELLLFLTFLSANLAVINFLPIPVLDGGHFVLLAYEGIRGKPANEKVQTLLAYIGLALILTLMIWVCGLDFGLIPRH
jgi:regulator of sigma E protease